MLDIRIIRGLGFGSDRTLPSHLFPILSCCLPAAIFDSHSYSILGTQMLIFGPDLNFISLVYRMYLINISIV